MDDVGHPRRVVIARELVVGRADEGVGLRIAARDVSREHARFTVDGGALWVEDLGSRNGTFVGGRRLRAPRRLRDGDEVHLGEHGFRVGTAEAHGVEGLEAGALVQHVPPPLPDRGRAGEPEERTLLLPHATVAGWRAALDAALRALRLR